MKTRLIAVGKLQTMYEPAQKEFLKRLTRYGGVELVETADEPVPQTLSDAQRQNAITKEWERQRRQIGARDVLIFLDASGEKLTSEALAQRLDAWQQQGPVTFLLGGSLGFPREALSQAHAVLSLSNMTFTHSLARVVLLEQLYRAFRILHHEPYHK
ncbi:MAG: 23S rRNA (pseudouridine(1915)-N(3))-methyltransferase RlmH [Clostridia bacterium]|nr:23S rRNA (pseudouridine(1915)-N(3))-methyltransferase RlmH [Clostridia bacterium]